MAGIDLSQVSSNWKKLQEQLQTHKKPKVHGNDLKRKRFNDEGNQAHKPQRSKAPFRTLERPNKRLRMGYSQSAPTVNSSEKTGHVSLIKKHDIPAADVSAAYNYIPGNSIRRADDKINSGLLASRKVGRYIALDCEMVGTGPPPHDDNVLARVSLVNYDGEQVYDSFVLPPAGIDVKDYRTHVSGVKEEDLRPGYARPLGEVQKAVADLLQDRILVGHALQNDFRVLLLSHPKRDIRDTSKHPKFRQGRPPALRDLVKRELGFSIQSGEHSSIEDARAAMMLFRKEKSGFEEENRKKFGSRKPSKESQHDKVHNPSNMTVGGDDPSDDADDDSRLDTLNSEEDELESEGEDVRSGKPTAGSASKKKRKKKKRTKRK